MADQEINQKQSKAFYIMLIIALIELIGLIVMWNYLKEDSMPVPVKEYFDKAYQRRQDSADDIIRKKDLLIQELRSRRSIRDSIRIIDIKKTKKQHEEVNNFNDSTRSLWWDSLFRANGIR